MASRENAVGGQTTPLKLYRFLNQRRYFYTLLLLLINCANSTNDKEEEHGMDKIGTNISCDTEEKSRVDEAGSGIAYGNKGN